MSHGLHAYESASRRVSIDLRTVLSRPLSALAGAWVPTPAPHRHSSSNAFAQFGWFLASRAITPIYLFIIAAVSIYDMLLTIRYADTLKSLEQNPLGRWMMRLDEIEHGISPDLTLFLSVKSIGTILVMLALLALVRYRARLGHPVGLGVAMCQLVLLWYLTLGET
ncbi:MAG: hypothetical protein ACK5OB_17320 [Pirellula sp.]|jgi:hypothetical protein